MRHPFFKRVVAVLTAALLGVTGLPLSQAFAQDETAAENYVPVSAIGAVTASSYQDQYEPEKAFDGIEGDAGNCWHTPWGEAMTDFPHWIMAELTTAQTIDALVYIPRSPTEYQFVTKYEVWISPDDNEANLEKVAEGEWSRGERGVATFAATEAKLVKFVVLAKTDANQNPEDTSVSASEIKFRLDQNAPADSYVPVSEIAEATASSYQSGYEPEKAFDGVTGENNCWHTPWEGEMPGFPHWIMAEFTTPQYIDALIYIPRSATGYQFVEKYEVWISPDDNEANLEKVAEGEWSRGASGVCTFPAKEAKLVKFVILSKADANQNPEDTSVSASEIKFRLNLDVPGAYDTRILETGGRADAVLDYTADFLGDGAYDMDPALHEALQTENTALQAMLGGGDADAILEQISRVEEAITALLSSNMAEGESLSADIPQSVMRVSANSSNASYSPEKAVDGNSATIWHSEWTPENDPFPHIFTIDLQKRMMLEEIRIAPRQDMDTGKITKGQIYVGDSLDDMALAAEFTADSTGKGATAVDLNFAAGRYVQIYSLASTSENTAISEIGVTTYDRGMAGAFRQYDDAVNMLRKATVGEEIGDYTADAVEDFEQTLAGFQAELAADAITTEGYYDITSRLCQACKDFAALARVYTRADLEAAIAELRDKADGLEPAADKAAADALLERAQEVYEDADAAREGIHDMCAETKDFIQSLDAAGSDSFDLSGEWGLALEAYSEGLASESKVTLPGTLDTNKEGIYNSVDDIARLSRYYTYKGPATYQKELYISEALADKNVSLYMERTRQTRVWVNGTEVLAPDSSNILPVAQQYDITSALRFGDYNTIVIQVDNSYAGLPQNGIKASHMATDETQTNWNGIVGEFKLQLREKVYIDDLRVYPNEDLQSVKVEVDVRNASDEAYRGTLHLSCEDTEGQDVDVSVPAGETVTFTAADYAMPADVQLWSEFDTPLYQLTAALDKGSEVTESFGMRAFRSEGTDFTINGDKVFLRSEANCAVFPLTGYAPMDEAGWEKLFTTYQSYGINAVRFHSWCPPDAAFRVADRLGMYLQPELSCWDNPMLSDEVRRTYYTKEAFAIIKEYANHPSFVMFSFGNELIYNNNDYLEQGDKLVLALKTEDPTRLYAPGSNVHFSSVDPSPNADYYTSQAFWGTPLRGSYGGMSGFINQEYPSTTVNYDEAVERIDAFDVPVFSFEVGQFQVFPDLLTEPEQYTGVLEARNFKLMAQRAAEQGMTEEDIRKAINASGMLSRLAYKAEIEAALRTEGLDGISLLGIQDFSGQGTALVGMMNALGDPKPYDFADPEEFSNFFAPVVPLLEIEKFSWTNDETLTGRLLISNYGPDDLESAMTYTLTDKDGQVFYEGQTDEKQFQQGSLTEAGTLSIPLSDITEPTQFKLKIACQDGKNSYNLWVYPADETVSEGEVYVTEYLDELALQVLEEGGKVFLSPKASKDALPQSVAGTFTTSFWSTGFAGETQPGSMGLLLDPDHPLFDSFPTDYHTDYQWWAMSELGRPMNLESLTDAEGNRIQPIIKMLDDFDSMYNMGLLYEAAVGGGKLMVSSMGLEQLQYDYPEAKALRNAILEYMNSDAFNPTFQLTVEQINEQVKAVEGDERENLASKYSGGKAFLGEDTITCQGGYDNKYDDRLLEINDGVVDVTLPSRSWTDFNNGVYPNDAQIGVELAGEYTVDTVAFSFFEDEGCAAPARIRVQYWNGRSYADVPRQDKSDGFTVGLNTITFAPVQTDKLLFIMEHVDGMAVAISEMFVYEKQVDPTAIQIRAEGDARTVRLNETLQLYIDTEPEYANNRNVKWTVTDEAGNPTELARVGFDGILRPAAAGKVIIHAELRSDPSITATLEIEIVEEEEIIPGDLTGDGKVSIEDVMAACRVIARKANGQQPLPDELARGDMNDDGKMLIEDVMSICRILARGE